MPAELSRTDSTGRRHAPGILWLAILKHLGEKRIGDEHGEIPKHEAKKHVLRAGRDGGEVEHADVVAEGDSAADEHCQDAFRCWDGRESDGERADCFCCMNRESKSGR